MKKEKEIFNDFDDVVEIPVVKKLRPKGKWIFNYLKSFAPLTAEDLIGRL